MAVTKQIKDKLNIWLLALLVGGNLIAFNYLISNWRGARLDLTQYHEHSLSPYTKKVLHELPDRVEIAAFFSPNTHKLLKPLIPKIRDILEDYVSESNGKVSVSFSAPSSDKAIGAVFEEYGIKPMPVPLESKYKQEVKSIYFDLVIKYGDQQLKFSLQDLIKVDEDKGQMVVTLKNMETLLTKGIKKAISSFSTLDSVLANISGRIEIAYANLPKSLAGRFPAENLKEIQEAEKKLKKEIEKYTKKFSKVFSFKEVEGSETNEPFVVTISYGRKVVGFRLFFDATQVSKSNVAENLEAALKRVLPGFTKTVGIVMPEPPFDAMAMRMGRRPPPSEFAKLQGLLGENYEVRKVDLSSGIPPVDVETLILFRPENFDDRALFAIDQYIMLGGRVAMFLDPGKLNLQALGMNKLKLDYVKSGLEEMISFWGVGIEDKILGDEKNFPYPLPREIQPGVVVMEEVPYSYFVKFERPSGHPIVDNLPEMGLLWPGALSIRKTQKALVVKPVLTSSSRAWLTPLDLKTGLDVTPSRSAAKSSAAPVARRSYPVAVAISGKFTSFFKDKASPLKKEGGADKAPKADNKGTTDKKGKTGAAKAAAGQQGEKLVNSTETKVVIVADADFISEVGMNILSQRFGYSLKFLLNSIEWLQSIEEDFVTSPKGLPRPLMEMGEAKKSRIQHMTWIISLALLFVIYLGLYFMRRRLAS
ncbi:Gldg family protein [Myxococcota bacterium]|nr:Gldg family protein [Myxococcota bacterium]MBU1537120.1 Gldg family protein [Myxococcota bacterium]